MTSRYSVTASGTPLSFADRRVVFHGVNKSGSLSMSNVLLEAYRHDGRSSEFHSHYHGRPKSLPEMIETIKNTKSGHAFFVGHYLYRAFDPALPGCAIVTQFRHPLPRVISCYSWLKRKNVTANGPDAPFPTLEQWVRRTKGWSHSQALQFGVGWGDLADTSVPRNDTKALLARALDNIEKHVAWHGIAEYFEESIFSLAHLCGLTSVVPWKKDDRNKEREPVSTLTDAQESLIREVFWADFELYDRMLERFFSRLRALSFGKDLAAYRLACASQYKDRITLPDAAIPKTPCTTAPTQY